MTGPGPSVWTAWTMQMVSWPGAPNLLQVGSCFVVGIGPSPLLMRLQTVDSVRRSGSGLLAPGSQWDVLGE